ncbi:MAG: hypothetical protein IPJ40_17600 [Saprospirales bacterium]|nr:hypothetical protein [Saprospirales bacterium]
MPGWTGNLNPKDKRLNIRPGGNFAGFSSSIEKLNVRAFVQGTIYAAPPEFAGQSAAELLASSYEKGLLEKLLPQLDGSFSAIIYGPLKTELLLITDRLGMQPIYIWEDPPYFGFSTELKEFLELEGFSVDLDPESMQCFWI